MKMLFALIVLVWAGCGMLAVIFHGMEKSVGSWLMVLFMLFVPFIPLIACLCGLI